MDFEQSIVRRLTEMAQTPDPDDSLWPENCAGSRKALVIFIGPSPGGKKEVERHEIDTSVNKPLWNQPYLEPLNWSGGFRASFKPIVELLFERPYEEAAKLIARFNLDWMANPESEDVAIAHMRKGSSYILPLFIQCKPKLLIPMDNKTFEVVQDGLILDGFDIDPIVDDAIRILIYKNEDRSSYHRQVKAVRATKDDLSFLVINSFQHPARIFDEEYAVRIGKAIRLTAEQIWNGEVVSFNID